MIGFYGLLSMEEILHVQTLVISQAAQGAGLGTDIMKSIEREARESGFTAVELCVQTTNPRAIHFYERLGFESHGMVFFSTLLMHKDVMDSP
jgi:ribosomal protein S18 acetylase RimI-like enzyme